LHSPGSLARSGDVLVRIVRFAGSHVA
jgi:hypothetical protein